MYETWFVFAGEQFPDVVKEVAGRKFAEALCRRDAWLRFLAWTKDEGIEVLYVAPEFRR